jgi:hypothetical protein
MSTFGTAGARRVVDSSMFIPGTTTHFGFVWNVAIGGGDVAFYEIDPSGSGIYFADDGSAVSQLVRTGDPLFGSTVTSLHLGQDGYDAATKRVAFNYELANGEAGVATAYVGSVPEPTMLGMSLMIPLLLRRRARRKSV